MFPKSFLNDFFQKLEFGEDCVAARFRDGIRESLSEIDDDTSSQNLLDQGWTLQVHQPQRFNENLWRLIASLESEFGSLVGCNAYITPKNGSQGLAPHYDDVSIFCCQIHGTKKWIIHLATPCLANHPSGDLESSALGKPFMEIELKPGDVLYLPRGTIHQASTNNEDSIHLTISFLQKWSFVDLLAKSLEACTALPPLQISIPDSLKATIYPTENNLEDLKSNVCQCVFDLHRYMSSKRGTDIVMNGLNAMKYDFMCHRMPPHPAQVPDKGPHPTIEDEIMLLGNFFYLFRDLNGEMSTKATNEGTVALSFKEGYDFRILSSLHNSRENHMMSSSNERCCDGDICEHKESREASGDENITNSADDDETETDDEDMHGSSILLPGHFETVLKQVFSGKPVQVCDLDLESDERKVDIAKTLYDFSICRTIPKIPASKKPKSK